MTFLNQECERLEFEKEIHPQARRRNEHGDYVLPSIQDRWAGWLARANNTKNHKLEHIITSLQDDLQSLKACVRGENRHSVVCMLEKLQEAIETLNQSVKND